MRNNQRMRIGIMGVVSDQFGSILAIKRDDSRTWCPPGGMLDAGELPTDGVAREVEEETGIKVLPVRLVGVEYVKYSTIPYLIFSFRCLKRGGELRRSAESLEVGMIPRTELDNIRMSSFHRLPTIDALNHADDYPKWTRRYPTAFEQFSIRLIRTFVYPYKNFRRKMRGGGAYTPPPLWEVTVSAVIMNDNNQTLWHVYGVLPNGVVASDQAAWELIENEVAGVELVDLAAVYVDDTRPMIHLVWRGRTNDAPPGYEWHDDPPETVHVNPNPFWIERWTAATDPMHTATQFIRTQL